jgi:hypothetical protein
MEEVSLSIYELYELRAQLSGFQDRYVGFINEKGISEGVKRLGYKALKLVSDEVTQIEEQRKKISKQTESDYVSSEDETEEVKLADIKALKQQADANFLDDSIKNPIKLQVQKLDFKKIEDLTLSSQYQLLYDKLFINA